MIKTQIHPSQLAVCTALTSDDALLSRLQVCSYISRFGISIDPTSLAIQEDLDLDGPPLAQFALYKLGDVKDWIGDQIRQVRADRAAHGAAHG